VRRLASDLSVAFTCANPPTAKVSHRGGNDTTAPLCRDLNDCSIAKLEQ
jgi:hypothetical protein